MFDLWKMFSVLNLIVNLC